MIDVLHVLLTSSEMRDLREQAKINSLSIHDQLIENLNGDFDLCIAFVEDYSSELSSRHAVIIHD